MPPAAASTLVLGAIVALAAALRLAGLGDQSYWYDEAVTARLLDGSLADVVDRLPDSESTPPLYYVLGWLWAQPAGLSEAGLRSLSAAAGIVAVPVVFLAARAAAGGAAVAGLVAAALVAANPMLVWYSQEARAYSLVALLAAASALALVRALERPTPLRLGLWSAAGVLLLLTHYFGAFLIAAEAAVLLARLRDRRRDVALACAPWLLAGLALLPLARAQEQDGRTSWIADEPLGERIADVVVELGTANTALVSSSSAAPGGAYWLVAALGLAVATSVVPRRAAAGLAREGPRSGAAQRRAGAAGGASPLALAGAAALLVPLLLALTPLDFFKDRNLIPAWPVLAIALGAALAVAPRAAVAAGAATVTAAGVAVCVAVAGDDGLQRADWRAAVERIGSPGVPRAVLVQPAYAQAPLAVYGLELAPPSPGTGVRELVVLGTEVQPNAAAGAVGALRVVERGTRGGVGFVRYRAASLQRLDERAIGNAGPGLHVAPSDAARRWTQRAGALAAGWQQVLAQPAPTDARADLAKLLPVPAELPDPGGLTRRLTRAAAAIDAFAADATEPHRAAAEGALAALG